LKVTDINCENSDRLNIGEIKIFGYTPDFRLIEPQTVTDTYSEFENLRSDKLFDGIKTEINNAWRTEVNEENPQSVNCVLAEPAAIRRYIIYPRYTYTVDDTPRDWTLEAWDGSSWVVLDSQQNIDSWYNTDGIGKTFDFKNIAKYDLYRITFTGINCENSEALDIGEIEMFE
jgi:hypothetical protein